MPEHDPLKFATGLSARLATRSRHVCAFFGAGVARACGLPDVAQLQERVLAALQGDDRTIFLSQLAGRNLEEALSRLRRITTLLSDGKTIDGMNAARAGVLDKAVCKAIVKELEITENVDLSPVNNFAAWVARASYRLPIELFTVNYDLLLETALEGRRVCYFDGFVGTLRAQFNTELVEAAPGVDGESIPAFFARLWKLHGSVNWAWGENHQIVRLGHPVTEGIAAAIYPSDAKYEESRRVPFVVLHDRLRRSLQQPETLVLIAGYSFSDQHLNDLIFDAASRRERSEFVAFCYSDIPEALSKVATTTPNLQVVAGRDAILGGVSGKWKQPENPPPNIWENDQFLFHDFRHLAAYLARSAAGEPKSDAAAIGEPDLKAGGKADA